MSDTHTWEVQIALPGDEVVETTTEVSDLAETRAELELAYPGATIVLAMLPRNGAHVQAVQG